MLVVTRYAVAAAEGAQFLAKARTALAALEARPGWRSSRIARAVDDPTAWVVATEWDSAGAYRRALSAYAVKVDAVPLLAMARHEPSAYEVLEAHGRGAEGLGGPSDLAEPAGTLDPDAERWW